VNTEMCLSVSQQAEFLDKVSDCEFLKEDCTPCKELIVYLRISHRTFHFL
jgi:hypothetical protein